MTDGTVTFPAESGVIFEMLMVALNVPLPIPPVRLAVPVALKVVMETEASTVKVVLIVAAWTALRATSPREKQSRVIGYRIILSGKRSICRLK
jgi:hypothetical protein